MKRIIITLTIILMLTACAPAAPAPMPTAVPPTVTLTPESTSTPTLEPTRAVEVIGASAVSFDVAEDGFITPPQSRDHYVEVVTLPVGTAVEGAVLTDSLGNVIQASHSDETSEGEVRLLFSVPRGQTGEMTVTLADGSVAQVSPPETEPENAIQLVDIGPVPFIKIDGWNIRLDFTTAQRDVDFRDRDPLPIPEEGMSYVIHKFKSVMPKQRFTEVMNSVSVINLSNFNEQSPFEVVVYGGANSIGEYTSSVFALRSGEEKSSFFWFPDVPNSLFQVDFIEGFPPPDNTPQ